MSKSSDRPHGLSRRAALGLPAALAAVAVLPKPQVVAATAPQMAEPIVPAAPTPPLPVKGPDGLTDWQRAKLGTFERIFEGREPAIKPMASVAGLSPAFNRMAIKLDVAVGEYREVMSYRVRIMEGIAHHEISQWIIDETGDKIPNPFLTRLTDAEDKEFKNVHRLIEKIETAKPVTRGDKTLRKRANALRDCNGFWQLNWLDGWWVRSDYVD